MTTEVSAITTEQVMAAAALVDLTLSGPDADEVVGLLSSWMPGAIALSARMQQVETIAPMTSFTSLFGVQNEEVS